MPEDMPDRMPEDMPDRMPEDMSDRMPEDLPVTKCINVMVGITRSKVILFFRYHIYVACVSIHKGWLVEMSLRGRSYFLGGSSAEQWMELALAWGYSIAADQFLSIHIYIYNIYINPSYFDVHASSRGLTCFDPSACVLKQQHFL